jgi:hypothetical protein
MIFHRVYHEDIIALTENKRTQTGNVVMSRLDFKSQREKERFHERKMK